MNLSRLLINIPKYFRFWFKIRLCLCSVYEQILSAYSHYRNRLIPCILSISTDSFRVFGQCTLVILNIRNGNTFFTAFKGILLKKKYVSVHLDRRPTRNNRLFGPSLLFVLHIYTLVKYHIKTSYPHI